VVADVFGPRPEAGRRVGNLQLDPALLCCSFRTYERTFFPPVFGKYTFVIGNPLFLEKFPSFAPLFVFFPNSVAALLTAAVRKGRRILCSSPGNDQGPFPHVRGFSAFLRLPFPEGASRLAFPLFFSFDWLAFFVMDPILSRQRYPLVPFERRHVLFPLNAACPLALCFFFLFFQPLEKNPRWGSKPIREKVPHFWDSSWAPRFLKAEPTLERNRFDFTPHTLWGH